jgi:hypothetical protein
LTGSTESPGQPAELAGSAEFLTIIFYKPSPVPIPDQPDPGLTRQARLDLKLCFKVASPLDVSKYGNMHGALFSLLDYHVKH